MDKIILIFKLIPAIIVAIQAIEEAIPGQGEGEKKLEAVRQMLLECAANYLGRELQEGKPADPEARYHQGNGAREERLNWAGDPSSKGQKQSYGLMVNYLYDLKRIDKHRSLLAQGKVPVSGDIDSLCRD